jgi:hypothetical protein
VVITHSLGASVGTALLFDTETKWAKADCDFRVEIARLAAVHPSPKARGITLALLAPAIPGEATFRDLASSPRRPLPIDRIVVGYNIHDRATSKNLLGINLGLNRKLGSTSLGSSQVEIDQTGKAIKRRFPKIDFKPVDFTANPALRIHGMEEYADQPLFDQFMDAIFVK